MTDTLLPSPAAPDPAPIRAEAAVYPEATLSAATLSPEELSPEELVTWRSFYAMRRTLDRAIDLQLLRDSRISASEYEVLLAIDAGLDERLRIRDIASRIGWEKSRVSHLVTRMEKRSLLNRTDCTSDARGSWVGLTPQGRRAIAAAMNGHVAALRRFFFDVLEGGEGERLTDLSVRIVAAIGCSADEDAPREPAVPGVAAGDG